MTVPDRSEAALTGRQRRMVPLLLDGLSEAAIGRILGIAERTVSYEVKALMETLGASGRVDLGYRLRQVEEPLAESRNATRGSVVARQRDGGTSPEGA